MQAQETSDDSANQGLKGSNRRTVFILGVLGLIPMLASLVLALLAGREGVLLEPATRIFYYYSIIVISFLAGIRWGYALTSMRLSVFDGHKEQHNIHTLILSTLPAIAAWATTFMPLAIAVGTLMLLHCLLGVWDSFSALLGHFPQWFANHRIVLTIIVVICHAILFFMVV